MAGSAKGLSMAGGWIVCGLVLPVVGGMFPAREQANSVLPAVVWAGCLFLVSLIVSAVKPNSTDSTRRWVGFGGLACVVGDFYLDFRDPKDHNLFPIEVAAVFILSVLALAAGAVIAKVWGNRAPRS